MHDIHVLLTATCAPWLLQADARPVHPQQPGQCARVLGPVAGCANKYCLPLHAHMQLLWHVLLLPCCVFHGYTVAWLHTALINATYAFAEAREDYLSSAAGFQAAKGFRGRRGSTTMRLDGIPSWPQICVHILFNDSSAYSLEHNARMLLQLVGAVYHHLASWRRRGVCGVQCGADAGRAGGGA